MLKYCIKRIDCSLLNMFRTMEKARVRCETTERQKKPVKRKGSIHGLFMVYDDGIQAGIWSTLF